MSTTATPEDIANVCKLPTPPKADAPIGEPIEPVAWRWSESGGKNWFDWTTDWTHHDKAKRMGFPIQYATPIAAPAAQPATSSEAAPAPVAPTEQQAHDMGATGGLVSESERVLFEAWMRGHCWALCATWDGKQYRSDAEQGGDVDPRAMATRRLWAAWRDRAALATPIADRAAPPAAQPAAPTMEAQPLTDEQAHAIHSHPFVRDCLLRYVDRPCDPEATAVVRAIHNAANGLMLGAAAPAGESNERAASGQDGGNING